MDIGEMRIAGGIDLNRDPVHAEAQVVSDQPFVNGHRCRPGPLWAATDEHPVDPKAIAAVGAQAKDRLCGDGIDLDFRTKVHINFAQVERMRRADPVRPVRSLHCNVPYCAASLFTSR